MALKSVGQADGVDWTDVSYLMHPRTGIRLSSIAYYRSAFLAVHNPFASDQDRAIGKERFAANCARCHGDTARGGAGPALVGRVYSHGDSDWATFHTIRDGVAGTAMLPAPLAADDIWRVMSFLRHLSTSVAIGARDSASTGGTASELPKASTQDMRSNAGTNLEEWLLPSGSYSAQRFSRDSQINAGNVGQLAVQWIYQFGRADDRIESVPIVVGHRLYVTLPQGTVMALDSTTGNQIWQFDRPLPGNLKLCCITSNRGVAVLGTRVFVGTLDGHLIALDATDGKQVWDQLVGSNHEGYSLTSAPLPVGNTLVVGSAGGDFPTRGYISAYDADTGALRWRVYTIPGAGEAGNETWKGDSWRTGGVAGWGIGSYDPELGLLYWGTGNPAPDYNVASRLGDNLYSNSVLALDAGTGRIVWHFQFTPGDDHDWDSIQTPILIDVDQDGKPSKLLAVANRNGFFYVLDRRTGKFIRGAAYAEQTWAKGLSPTGRPETLADSHPTTRGTFVFPSVSGATNWWMAAYSPATGLYYVDVLERGGIFFSSETPPKPATGELFVGSGGRFVDGDSHYGTVRAIDAATAQVKWERRNSNNSDWPRGGLLATAGGLLFGSDTATLYALDAATGVTVWTFNTGGQISAAPISYRVGGRQYIAVAAGESLLSFALPASVTH